MNESILSIVEESLLNIAKRYKEFSNNPDVAESDLKGFDEQLNDIMDRYNKLKGLQSTYTAEELTIKLNEFQILYDDLVLKIGNGFFKGADGKDGTNGIDGQNGIDGKDFTFDMFTPEQLVLLKGEKGQDGTNGIDGQNGIDGKDFTYEDFTPEQLALLKGADGIHGLDGDDGLSAYQIALNNGFVGSEIYWLESLKGADGQNGIDGKDFTFDMFTPEQLALLKGEKGQDGIVTFADLTPEQLALLKGDKGQDGTNGIDGQSLTYDSLTTAQKEDFASHVIVSGGGSSSDVTFRKINIFNNTVNQYIHVKTNIKYTVPFSLKLDGFNYNGSTINKNFNSFFMSYNPESNVAPKVAVSPNDNTFVASSYVSSDGFHVLVLNTFYAKMFIKFELTSYLNTFLSSSFDFVSIGSSVTTTQYGVFNASTFVG